LLKHIEENRAAGAAMKEFEEVLPSLSRRQILGILQELRSEGKIHPEGQRRGARWKLGAEGQF
jgi:hypothetical protein